MRLVSFYYLPTRRVWITPKFDANYLNSNIDTISGLRRYSTLNIGVRAFWIKKKNKL